MRGVKALLFLAVAAVLAWGGPGARAEDAVPVPRPRPLPPAVAAPPSAAIPVPTPRPVAGQPRTAVLPPAPVPRPRPGPDTAPTIPVPQSRPPSGQAVAPEQPPAAAEPAPGGGVGWPAAAVAAARADCASLLSGLPVAYRPLDPIGAEGDCGAPAPIEITAVAGVTLTPPATETCAMAAALAAWVTEDVQPAARKDLDTQVTGIRTATSYSCRRRNNAATGKMSEHSKANALDMSGFTFARQDKIAVGGSDNWGRGQPGSAGPPTGGSFLEDVRKAACSHFTTVLGPGSDPYHGDHFHVDVLARKGGYRICQ